MRDGLGWLVVLGVLGAGCGGASSSGVSGLAATYVTSAHSRQQPCSGAASTEDLDPPYFQVKDDGLINGRFVDVVSCTDAKTCDDNRTLAFLALDQGGGRFLAEQLQRSPDGDGSCLVTWTGTTVQATASGDGVSLRTEDRLGTWTGNLCTVELGDAQIAMGRTLDCRSAESWTGKKL